METLEFINRLINALAVPFMLVCIMLLIGVAVSSERRMGRVNEIVHNLCVDRNEDRKAKYRMVDSNNVLIHECEKKDAEITKLREELSALREQYAVLKNATEKTSKPEIAYADNVRITHMA